MFASRVAHGCAHRCADDGFRPAAHACSTLLNTTRMNRHVTSVYTTSALSSFHRDFDVTCTLHGGLKTWGQYTSHCSHRRSAWTIIICMCLAHFNAVSFWTHQLTQMSQPGEIQQPGCRFRRLVWEFKYKMWNRTSLSRLVNKIDSSSVERREDKSGPRCAWTFSGISEWWRRLECVLWQNGGHMKYIFKWKNDVCAVRVS